MKEFTYPSQDGLTVIRAGRWEPSDKPRAVLQFIHGMHEHIECYAPMAEYMAAHGLLVVGNDHLGHGKSICDETCRGYFAKKDGNGCVLGDIHTLRTQIQQEYPGLPYFVLGHSMGSFLVRQYMERYAEGLAGVIVMGTGYKDGATLAAARGLSGVLAQIKGGQAHSALMDKLTLGDYNKHFAPNKTPNDWLTRDESMMEWYATDPMRNFRFTLNAYYNMFVSFQEAQDAALVSRIPKDLPVLLVSGGNDPVGDFGKGVEKALAIYKKAGIANLSCKIYPEDRHEILNELDKEQVCGDLLAWMEKHGA